ncbi:MAG TPA: glycosyltransferase [Thermodesulfobacteriota bacterium]
MKRILVLDTGKEWGGGTNSLIELMKRADRTRFSFTALFYEDYGKGRESSLKAELGNIGVDTIILPRRPKGAGMRLLKEVGRAALFPSRDLKKRFIFRMDYLSRILPDSKRIAAILKQGGFDLLYMNNQPSTNLEGIIAAREAGVPCVQHTRIAVTLNPFEARAVNELVSRVMCVSRGVRDGLVKSGVEAGKCVVVHNGVDASVRPARAPEDLRRSLGFGRDAIVVGTVGSLVKRKRISMLLEAVAALKDRGDIRCVVVGEGPEMETLKSKADVLGMGKKTVFTGFSSDALSYINSMDVFVLPSANEGLPRVILEAMLMGKPVVAFDVTGTGELVTDGQTGFLAPDGDLGALTEKIALLADSAALRTELGKRAKERVLRDFSIESYVNGVEGVLTAAARDERPLN